MQVYLDLSVNLMIAYIAAHGTSIEAVYQRPPTKFAARVAITPWAANFLPTDIAKPNTAVFARVSNNSVSAQCAPPIKPHHFSQG